MAVDYKQKYEQMREKMISTTDVAYRLGYEEGLKTGEQNAQAEQIAQQQQAEMMAAQQQIDPETGEVIEGGMPGEEMGGEMSPQAAGEEDMSGIDEEGGSELDSAVSELEGLVQKGEKPTVLSMRSAVEKLADIRKSQKNQVKKIADKSTAKQSEFINGLIKKWENDAKDIDKGLDDILDSEIKNKE